MDAKRNLTGRFRFRVTPSGLLILQVEKTTDAGRVYQNADKIDARTLLPDAFWSVGDENKWNKFWEKPAQSDTLLAEFEDAAPTPQFDLFIVNGPEDLTDPACSLNYAEQVSIVCASSVEEAIVLWRSGFGDQQWRAPDYRPSVLNVTEFFGVFGEIKGPARVLFVATGDD